MATSGSSSYPISVFGIEPWDVRKILHLPDGEGDQILFDQSLEKCDLQYQANMRDCKKRWKIVHYHIL